MTTKTKLVGGFILLLAVFLIGFVPQYLERQNARTELLASSERGVSLEAALKRGELRDLCGMMLLEVLQQNYGLAREHSSRYFEALRLAVEDVQNPLGPPLRELLNRRDSLTTMFAQSDPASLYEVQTLCRRTHQITKP